MGKCQWFVGDQLMWFYGRYFDVGGDQCFFCCLVFLINKFGQIWVKSG